RGCFENSCDILSLISERYSCAIYGFDKYNLIANVCFVISCTLCSQRFRAVCSFARRSMLSAKVEK
ncbi:hypothetical protein, partial [Enterobacter kobei]|uniref:hypothetical protein n=1 Tax=Enterobacter kobei TaxID=208224 RepID=UPI0021475559